MVKIVGYNEVATKDGRSFISLDLHGGVEMVQSTATGKFYCTVRTCRIPSTFSEEIAKTIIGQELDGNIVRVAAEPYQYVSPKTGEVMTLQHTYSYQPLGSMGTIGHVHLPDALLVEQ